MNTLHLIILNLESSNLPSKRDHYICENFPDALNLGILGEEGTFINN